MSPEEELSFIDADEWERVKKYKSDRLTFVATLIWGDDMPYFSGSPHEGEPLDGYEVVLHELCHHVFLPPRYSFQSGKLADAHAVVTDHIDKLPLVFQDVHEVLTVATELEVGRRMKAGLNWRSVCGNSYRNCSILESQTTPEHYVTLVRRARKTPIVQTKADIVMELFRQTRKDFEKTYGPIRVSIHSRRQQRTTGN